MAIANLERPWGLVGDLKVKKLEKSFGFSFPKDYSEFLAKQNGGGLVPEHYCFMMFSGKQMRAGVHILYGIDAEFWGDINEKLETFHRHERRMPEFLLPIGCDSGGNQICVILDKNRFGEVVHWNMESEIEYDKEKKKWLKDPMSNCHFIASSFSEFLTMLKSD
ncbi:MAG: SMI1/KNR4 family protein [Pseudobdellovibrionaceae bacterium]|nr:SMI1/KNR4 family protein [Pseudobdellovibrionaceae bacterium]